SLHSFPTDALPISVGAHRPLDQVLAGVAADPVNCRVHVLAVVANMNDDTFDQAADDRLAVGVSRARGVPEGRDVAGHCTDPDFFFRCERCRSFASEPIMFLLNVLLLTERFFPVLL